MIYFDGEAKEYFPQFYQPYEHYPNPILAIPGNHDGDRYDRGALVNAEPSLAPFVRNFCASHPGALTADAREATRTAMVQPNVYFTLNTPFATIVGLYTNVPEGGTVEPDQRAWFAGELRAADPAIPLLVAMHHPIHSLDIHHSGSRTMAAVLAEAISASSRRPDMVFAAHVHNYQRFTITGAGGAGDTGITPFIVAGNGGYHNLHKMAQDAGQDIATPYRAPQEDNVMLEAYVDDRFGFLRLEAHGDMIDLFAMTVPRPQEKWSQAPRLYDRMRYKLAQAGDRRLEPHAGPPTPPVEYPRMDVQTDRSTDEALHESLVAKLLYAVGKSPERASPRDWLNATALVVRDRVVETWTSSAREARAVQAKRVHYFSLEFLIGRLLFDAAGNLGMIEQLRRVLARSGVSLDDLRAEEPDAALGNGGLGRLAACFMESMATLRIPAFGYGIRYDHGLFRQSIVDGWQQERPENWLANGNPWEFQRPELCYSVGFGGAVAAEVVDGRMAYHWHPSEIVEAVAFDTPIVGYGNAHANTLRLWSARATDPLQLDAFNRGDHVGALRDRVRAEAISRVLYPGDDSPAGQELRLRQEFFFASASLQDLVRRHVANIGDIHSLALHNAVQLNDTHPAIGVAELMRLLIDKHGVAWDEAWDITRATISYTNHTLLPEALEMWPVLLLERLLPRQMQIVYLLNARHLDAMRAKGADDRLLAALSLIDEQHGRRVRMGHLAFMGSHSVNGVSALHTDLMRRTTFRELDTALGGRIVNRTNGITFRRWLHQTNPGLTRLLVDALGERVLHDPMALEGLRPLADDPAFRAAFAAQRRERKAAVVRLAAAQLALTVDPDALFDVQIKRIHEYKRQLLNVLHAISLYNAIRAHPTQDWRPRVKFFAGKAAPSYLLAKQIIRLAHDVARVVNGDPTVRGKLQVAFLPNYNVSLAEVLIPAADLSEQISTAGMEASGTGNMKLALNGALTIGTMDGANVEISERVGREKHVHLRHDRRRGGGPPRRRPGRARRGGGLPSPGAGAGRAAQRRVLAGGAGPLPRHGAPAGMRGPVLRGGGFRRLRPGADRGRCEVA